MACHGFETPEGPGDHFKPRLRPPVLLSSARLADIQLGCLTHPMNQPLPTTLWLVAHGWFQTQVFSLVQKIHLYRNRRIQPEPPKSTSTMVVYLNKDTSQFDPLEDEK